MAANTLVCLIHQANYLLDQQLRALRKGFWKRAASRKGSTAPTQARNQRKRQMTYTEDDLIPISALQHIIFCERQCALIHIEQVWDENRLTAEGRIMHERVHEQAGRVQGRGSGSSRGLPLAISAAWAGREWRMWWSFIPCRAAGGSPFRWSTSGESQNPIIATRSSFAPRPCVWRR